MSKRFRRRKGKSSLALRAFKLAKRVRRDLQSETKHIDTAGTQQIDATTGNVINLNRIAQGHNASQREGDEVRYTSLIARFKLSQDTANQNAVTRVVIFRVKSDTYDAATTPPTMFNTPTRDLLDDASPLSPIDWDNRKMYQVLYTQMFAGNADSVDNWAFKISLKFKNGNVHFKDTTADHSGAGGLFLGMLCDGGTTIENPSLQYNIRIKYIDN